VHQDRYTRTLVHIVGAEQSHMDHLVQNGRTRPVGCQTKRGKRHTTHRIHITSTPIACRINYRFLTVRTAIGTGLSQE